MAMSRGFFFGLAEVFESFKEESPGKKGHIGKKKDSQAYPNGDDRRTGGRRARKRGVIGKDGFSRESEKHRGKKKKTISMEPARSHSKTPVILRRIGTLAKKIHPSGGVKRR